MIILAFCAAFSLAGCSSAKRQREFAQDPAIRSAMEAAHFLETMATEGGLVGFEKGEHGMIRSHRLASGAAVDFPQQFTFQIEKASSDPSIYWYEIVKKNEDSEWQIVKAWKTDFQGLNRQDLIH